MKTSTFLHSLTAAFVLSVSGCGDSATNNPCGGPTPEERAQNQAIFDALSPHCASCHISGARGYFASIEAFESLLVYNPAEVVPGKPDESELVRLLIGQGTRAFKQMPIAGPTYADLASQGKTKKTVEEIKTWIMNLVQRDKDPLPSLEARRVTRLSAEDVQRTLYQQLGLSDADFFVPASNYDIPHKSTGQLDDKYPISSPDAAPAPFEQLPVERYASLGGGSAGYQMKADGTISPSFLGTLSQISQRWCAMALDKAGNTALLPAGASIQTGSSDPAAVKTVLRAWYLHFHAVRATDAEVDTLFQNVFVPLEQGKDSRTAYIGTCSYFIRHPDWILY